MRSDRDGKDGKEVFWLTSRATSGANACEGLLEASLELARPVFIKKHKAVAQGAT